MIRFSNITTLPKALLLVSILVFATSIANAIPFTVLHEKIENNPNLTPNTIKKLANEEFKSFTLTHDYAHILHILYLNYELNKRFYKKNDRIYKIKTTYYIKNAAKKIDPQLYFSVYSEYIQFILDKKEQLKYYLELNDFCVENKMDNKTIDNLLSIAYSYYQLNNYNKAIEYWQKSLVFIKPIEFEKKASILNNIACTYDDENSISKAIKFNQLAIIEINKIKNKNLNEQFFYYLLLGNRGSYAKKNGDIKTAYSNFKANYDFYFQHKKYYNFLASIVSELIELNEKYNTPIPVNINAIETIFNGLENNEEKNIYLELLVKYYEHEHNYIKSSYYTKKLLAVKEQLNTDKIAALELVNKQLNNDKFLASIQKKALMLEVESKKTNLVYIVIAFIFAIASVIIYYKLKNTRRRAKMLIQKNELELVRQKAIENELKFQKESNLHLQLNLDIKQKSEQVFMEKLKEIRRKKHNDPEEIIKELQLQIINLLQIDKKNKNKTKEKSSEDNSFTISLIELNKNLSEQELRLCTYFKMNLSTKEISQLEQHLAPASIRVLKNRIKKKLELGPEDNLNQFLNSLGIEI